jgi:hypothetical protein
VNRLAAAPCSGYTGFLVTVRQQPSQDVGASNPAKVRVSDIWRVVHDGESYVKGDELTVPENVAQEWERSGYVERVTGKSCVTGKS